MINPFSGNGNRYLVREPTFPIQPPKDIKPLDFGEKDFPKYLPHG